MNFKQKVYHIASKIPQGKVMTYGQLAAAAGNKKAARAVGMLMAKNPDRNIVPCHRVVASNGELTGYSYGKGVTTKMAMLKKEGVQFINGRVDLSKSKFNL